MTVFNEVQHPRQVTGRFAQKAQSRPEMIFGVGEDADAVVNAGSAFTGSAALLELAAHPSRDVRARVAENPNSGTAVLRELAGDVDYGVRRSVAANPRTHPYEVGILASEVEPNATIRTEALRNPNLPPRIAQRIVSRGSVSDQFAVAGNRGLSETFLLALARSPHRSVRSQVTSNLGASKATRDAAGSFVEPVTLAVA